MLLATATNIVEGRAAAKAGVHESWPRAMRRAAIASIHPDAVDDRLRTLALTRILVRGLGTSHHRSRAASAGMVL